MVKKMRAGLLYAALVVAALYAHALAEEWDSRDEVDAQPHRAARHA